MKPHIYRGMFDWFCTDGRWLGWGSSPQRAYEVWRSRGPLSSCVHNRETPLQMRRRHDAGGWVVRIVTG